MSRPIRLFVCPYHLGSVGEGVGGGPRRLMELGAAASLGRAGSAVSVHEIAYHGSEDDDELTRLIGTVGAVARSVSTSSREGELAVVLGGNCATSLGVLSALDPKPTVVWLDAHGDFNTPQTSESGFLDGMALAAAVGDCWRPRMATVPGHRPVRTVAVVLAGTRDLDAGEAERIARSPVRHLPADDLVAVGLPRLDGQAVHLHLDLDVLHAALGPVNSYGTSPGGVPLEGLLELIGGLAGRATLRSVTISSYDPRVDEGGVGPAAIEILELLGAA
jgi:arginase